MPLKQRHPKKPSPETPVSERHSANSRRPPRGLAIAALLIGTGIVAGVTDTPAVWGVPGAILIAGMWITGRPRRVRIRAAASAAILLTVAGAVLISPAVLLAWPAAGLVRLVRRRGLRAARVPLTVAAAVAALAVTAAQLGFPVGIALLAILPLVLISRRHAPMRCRATA